MLLACPRSVQTESWGTRTCSRCERKEMSSFSRVRTKRLQETRITLSHRLLAADGFEHFLEKSSTLLNLGSENKNGNNQSINLRESQWEPLPVQGVLGDEVSYALREEVEQLGTGPKSLALLHRVVRHLLPRDAAARQLQQHHPKVGAPEVQGEELAADALRCGLPHERVLHLETGCLEPPSHAGIQLLDEDFLDAGSHIVAQVQLGQELADPGRFGVIG